MCRQCGEPDRRGSALNRRRRVDRLLHEFGNGVICPCVWCGILLGRVAGLLYVPATTTSPMARRLRVVKLEQDRLMPGGPYAYWNLVPSCGPCNKARTYARVEVAEGGTFGPVGGGGV